MDLDHVGDHISGSQGIIDPIVSLRFTVTDIGGKIPCPVSACLCDSGPCLFHKLQQVSAARVAVTKCTLDHNLGFRQILQLPSCSQTERI